MADHIRAAGAPSAGHLRLRRGGLKKGTKEAGKVDFYDYNLLAVIILLTAFGLVIQYSVTAYDMQAGRSSAFIRQVRIAAAGTALMIVCSRINYHLEARFALAFYTICCLLLVATRFIGTSTNGATRWIRLGPISFQPSELAKLAVILFVPVLIVKMGSQFRTPKGRGVILLVGIITFLLTYVFTENLSTALIIFGITYILIIVASPHPKWYVIVFLSALAAVILFYVIMKNSGPVSAANVSSFRIRRILVWIDPEDNLDYGGYQVMQGLYAIGSGGLFGKGLGNSTQKLGALPEAENDMIFAIICEELGLIGAFIVIGLFVYLLYRLFVIAVNAPDLLGSLITVGIFTHVALQVLLNIAVVLNFIPTTGITLPFISYGGTSLLFLMLEMSVALNISGQIVEKKR